MMREIPRKKSETISIPVRATSVNADTLSRIPLHRKTNEVGYSIISSQSSDVGLK